MQKKLNTLLIANRGEIAVRIIRAARELGIRTVLAHSSADRESLAAQMADARIEIGPAQASKSYLNIPAIITAARQLGAEAIHPGYGFLSENAQFAAAVEAAGLHFIGPTSATIERMGNKVSAKRAAMAAGVSILPGSDGLVADLEQALAAARLIGYPLLIKAAAGGGGRGIRRADNEAELGQQFLLAKSEAAAAFNDDGLYLERLIQQARHIEVQILGDGEQVVHLFERECSLQRRRQKLLEEAGQIALDETIRQAMCDSAVRLARELNYRGAGTLEFLYDAQRGQFFFIEMNTRIQVEHPVTEMITGIDLVRHSLLVCSGHRLAVQQKDIVRRGHAIEIRINAENPARNFQPNIGTVTQLNWPSGPGVRVDTMLYPGYKIPPYYDSLLAKLIILDQDRPAALARLARALRELQIEGVVTNAGLYRQLLNCPEIQHGHYHINWLEQWLEKSLDVQAAGDGLNSDQEPH